MSRHTHSRDGVPSTDNTINNSAFPVFGNAPPPSVAFQIFSTMYLIKLTPLASVASVAFSQCVRYPYDCPDGTRAEVEPEICRDMGYPPQYYVLCVEDDHVRDRSFDRWSSRGPRRQRPLRESMCIPSGGLCMK
ncbi:hypothetical protein BGW42_000742, partial [Actinomortierella wolfii]